MSNSFEKLVFPYCLQQLGDGSYVALNRAYKPVGFNLGAGDWVKYEEFPVSFRFKSFTKAMAARLSASGDDNVQCVYLYADGHLDDAAKRAKYFSKLERLGQYLVD